MHICVREFFVDSFEECFELLFDVFDVVLLVFDGANMVLLLVLLLINLYFTLNLDVCNM